MGEIEEELSLLAVIVGMLSISPISRLYIPNLVEGLLYLEHRPACQAPIKIAKFRKIKIREFLRSDYFPEIIFPAVVTQASPVRVARCGGSDQGLESNRARGECEPRGWSDSIFGKRDSKVKKTRRKDK
jgi:hypothetical protein